jgi:hypothetical protein
MSSSRDAADEDNSFVDDDDDDDHNYTSAEPTIIREQEELQVVFAKMRWFVHYGYKIPELEDLYDPLRKLYKRAGKCYVKGVSCNDEFVSICLKVWKLLAKASKPFTLPFVYTSAHFEMVFKEIFWRIRALERDGLPAGGNKILNGVKGVGKTTVLKVIGMVVSCICPAILPVFWTYETNGDYPLVSVYRLYKASHHIFTVVGTTSKFRDILRAVDDEVVCCDKALFLLDEFTVLYTERTLCQGIEVVSHFRDLARGEDVMFVMAASRVNVRKYVHPQLDNNLMGYPNLNQGLFAIREIPPLRDVASFQAFIQSSYNETISEEEARIGIEMTGGVGRHIIEWKRTGVVPNNLYNVTALQNDPKLWHIACELVEREISITARTDYAALAEWDRWCDDMILYNTGTSLQFLFDSNKKELKKLLEDNPDYFLAHRFHLQRTGLSGRSTGHANESLICKYIPAMLGLQPNSESLDLSVQTNGASCCIASTGALVPFTSTDDLTGCCHRLFKWKVSGSETGLDRIWFEPVSEFDFVLHAIQIKTGKDSMTITAGVLETQRKQRKALLCDDGTIAGILSKAEKGFMVLLPQLRKLFPRCRFSVGKLLICTNKNAQQGFQNFFAENMAGDDYSATHEFPSEFQDIYGCDSCECRLFDGMRWIENMLPPHLRALI